MSTTVSRSSRHHSAKHKPWIVFLSGALKRWRSTYKAWRIQQAAIKRLNLLDDRQLKDIGLHRSEITRVVLEGARRGRVFDRCD